ncbi:hypothetical protein TrVFT333_002595 [Trichoderma virens FT-333]|nr:hypothetical protein TrVFT333_002595 [Trichoderma virens FT-333]
MFSRSFASSFLRQAARPAARAPLSAFRTPVAPLTPFQIRLLSDTTRTAIDKAIASAPVILGIQGVSPEKFAAFNVLEDPELRAGIKEYSDWPTIPQLYVDKQFVGGCDILVSMHQNGDLQKLFEENKVLVEGRRERRRSRIKETVHIRNKCTIYDGWRCMKKG